MVLRKNLCASCPPYIEYTRENSLRYHRLLLILPENGEQRGYVSLKHQVDSTCETSGLFYNAEFFIF